MKKKFVYKKIISYFFIVIFTLSCFYNVQSFENIHNYQNTNNQSVSFISCEDIKEICFDAVIDTKLTSDYIQTLHKKTGITSYRYSRKTNRITVFLIPITFLIGSCFLDKKDNRIIYSIVTTFSMRWIIKYIHYKNGVKHMVSSVFS